MHEYGASRTALRVAARRAAHQILDRPPVFEDPLALAIVGAEAVEKAASEASSPSLRAFIAARSRFAEDELARAVERGVRQYVVLGAGLDTFAYRNPHVALGAGLDTFAYRNPHGVPGAGLDTFAYRNPHGVPGAGLDTFAYRNPHVALGLRVFEVDHPATQEWKRGRLRTAGIEIPAELVFVAMNFERQSLAGALPSAGFRAGEPAFFSWLGVVPYLTEGAFLATMSFIAGLPPSSGVVFDYAVARHALSLREQLAFDALASRVAAAGEPFHLFFDPAALAAQVRQLGFRHLEDLAAAGINSRYFLGRADGLSIRGRAGHLLCARV
jgi:O-methyltransferase involved in polyketide biosynthesis